MAVWLWGSVIWLFGGRGQSNLEVRGWSISKRDFVRCGLLSIEFDGYIRCLSPRFEVLDINTQYINTNDNHHPKISKSCFLYDKNSEKIKE